MNLEKIICVINKYNNMKCIITIELGTYGVRVFAFDLDGHVIGSMKGYHPTFHTEPDKSEQDPEQIFITTLYLLKNLLNEHIHPKKHKVVCICFSASMHSVLAVDKNGNPLGYAITWADNRAKKEAQERVYIILNKPRGVYCTNVAQGEQKRAIDLLPPEIDHRVYPVGRLDAA